MRRGLAAVVTLLLLAQWSGVIVREAVAVAECCCGPHAVDQPCGCDDCPSAPGKVHRPKHTDVAPAGPMLRRCQLHRTVALLQATSALSTPPEPPHVERPLFAGRVIAVAEPAPRDRRVQPPTPPS